jgi:hypothetical protein
LYKSDIRNPRSVVDADRLNRNIASRITKGLLGVLGGNEYPVAINRACMAIMPRHVADKSYTFFSNEALGGKDKSDRAYQVSNTGVIGAL